ncbi:YbaB/EbfC family nucleoid-associated protein [Nocardia sp. CDC160]|uniref:YbaB/EbfC family nucleoid-associated protein n=1 Tax=Nocardia sp. CDC160 TaxID=3112166 RepID=UPI002DBCD909|nr:YbaB/EbfC family nucleoid-associated protein [Nocardia sp. CDC160]MEC3920350.1 YbaB/EbfC family nucleoid-associated protein [Nocardia sp. CDC160]
MTADVSAGLAAHRQRRQQQRRCTANRVEIAMNHEMDRIETAARRQMDDLNKLADAIASIRIRESSPDGAVTVMVDGRGALVELVLSDSISRLSPLEFEKLVVDTCQSAARSAFAEHGSLISDFNQQSVTYGT